jgi:hypothetical protein
VPPPQIAEIVAVKEKTMPNSNVAGPTHAAQGRSLYSSCCLARASAFACSPPDKIWSVINGVANTFSKSAPGTTLSFSSKTSAFVCLIAILVSVSMSATSDTDPLNDAGRTERHQPPDRRQPAETPSPVQLACRGQHRRRASGLRQSRRHRNPLQVWPNFLGHCRRISIP